MQRSATTIGKRISSAHTASFKRPASPFLRGRFFYAGISALSLEYILWNQRWKGAVGLNKSVIITLRGKNISGVARLELCGCALRAVFSLRPPQPGSVTAFFLCPGRIAEARLSEMQCRLNEPLAVEGVLLARDTPDGPVFFAEGGALHTRLNFSRIRETIRFRWAAANTPSGGAAAGAEAAPPEALPETASEHRRPPESSACGELSAASAPDAGERPPVPVRAEDLEEIPFPPPRSEAAKNILEQARGLYPRNRPLPAAPRPSLTEPAHTPEPGLQTSAWSEEVRGMLLLSPSAPNTPAGEPAQPPMRDRSGQTRSPACGLRRMEPAFNPFPDVFPRSCWKKAVFPGTGRYYLEGEALKGNARFLIHALPGEYSPTPLAEHRDFTKFLRAADGRGYWLRIRRKPR